MSSSIQYLTRASNSRIFLTFTELIFLTLLLPRSIYSLNLLLKSITFQKVISIINNKEKKYFMKIYLFSLNNPETIKSELVRPILRFLICRNKSKPFYLNPFSSLLYRFPRSRCRKSDNRFRLADEALTLI